MKKIEVLNLFTILQKVNQEKIDGFMNFKFAISLNLKLLEPIVKIIQSNRNNLDKFQEFENKRMELIKKYGKKDSIGNLITDIQGNVEFENKEQFDIEFKHFQEENTETIQKLNEDAKKYVEFLNTDYEQNLNLYKISMKEFPTDLSNDLINELVYIVTEFTEYLKS